MHQKCCSMQTAFVNALGLKLSALRKVEVSQACVRSIVLCTGEKTGAWHTGHLARYIVLCRGDLGSLQVPTNRND